VSSMDLTGRQAADRDLVKLSPDGGLVVVQNLSSSGLALWNIREKRLVGVIPGVGFPCAFEPRDGSCLIATENEETRREIAVIGLETLTPSARFQIPSPVCAVGLTPGATHAIAEFYPWKSPKPGQWFCYWDLSTGRAELSTISRFPNLGDNLFITGAHESDSRNELSCAVVEYSLPANIHESPSYELSPDRRVLLICGTEKVRSPVRAFVERLGIRWPFSDSGPPDAQIYDAASGRMLGAVSGHQSFGFSEQPRWPKLAWSPGGDAVATCQFMGEYPRWSVWDIPPRKSLTWFAAGAALLALPIALVSWCRTRKLRPA
jgi:hypothetical protein